MKNNEASIFTFYHEICLQLPYRLFHSLKITFKYLEINIISAEANTTKEFIATLPAFQMFVTFIISPLRSSSNFHFLIRPGIIFFIHNFHY